MDVLISLHKGYGLGDAVQMSSVLRHVVKYRPNWRVTYQAEDGYQLVGNGLVDYTVVYGKPYPRDHYDAEIQIILHEVWRGYSNKPNTRVSYALDKFFDIPWDSECAKYHIHIDSMSAIAASAMLYGCTRLGEVRNKRRCVAIHYQGDSVPSKKNLTHSQIENLCNFIEDIGCEPIIIDFRNRCLIKNQRRLSSPLHWGRDAQMNAAVIAQCAAFIGIDSGPAKCASATDTPSLVIWTGHHPAQFHDPAPNTTHLVPHDHHTRLPVGSDEVVDWFKTNYNVLTYTLDPIAQAESWLYATLTSQATI